MLVWEILERSAERWGERPAVWHKDQWMTYGELLGEARRFAAFLIRLGVEPGERVALLLENSTEYVAAHFGTLMAGAVEVSLNTELKREGLRSLLEDCEARVLIAGAKFARTWREIQGGLPHLRHVITDLPWSGNDAVWPGVEVHSLDEARRSAGGHRIGVHREETELASLVYTSGVTGKAKGVMLSHRNLTTNTEAIVEYLGLLPEDRMMVVLPFHYIYGRSLLYTHLFSGGSLVLENRFAFPATALQTMEDMEVTALAGVPSTFSILLRKTNAAQRRFPHLRLVTQAGGGMAPALQREVADVFHPARLFIMYGSTEAAPRLTYVEPEILPRKWGSIGRAIPGVEVWVVDEEGGRVPPGAAGEIAARGPNIMMGYWKDPEGTARVLRHGLYFTGDLGYADEEGYIFLTGRAGDMIKTGGNRVSAKEVEDAILECPEVVEAAVIGIPDPILGEAIKALVVVSSGSFTAELLRKHLGTRLPGFKIPKHVEIRSHLPKNQAGKVLKALLKAEVAC